MSLERFHWNKVLSAECKPFDSIVPNDLITDGTVRNSINLGNGKIIRIPSSYGEIKGKNLYHSFKSFDLGSTQEIFAVPEGSILCICPCCR